MTGKAVTRPDGTDYLSILANDIPLIDVRAPVEFQTGAFPGACNLPLMLDSEREAVGICYKQQGQDAAIALGNRLVHGEVRAARIAAWREQCQRHPGAISTVSAAACAPISYNSGCASRGWTIR